MIQHPKTEPVFADYPGAVFVDEKLSYPEAMKHFVAASASEVKLTNRDSDIKNSAAVQRRADKRALRQDEEALRAQRRQQRQCRQLEDAAFKTLKAERRAQQQRRHAQRQATKRPQWGSKKAFDEQWKASRQQRQEQIQPRKLENQQWRLKREQLRVRASQLQLGAWIALLVVVDNCTRQSLGLPLFVTGAKVTAPMVVEALRQLLPAELQFLISDRGPQFTADLMKQLASEKHFIHVVIARHRPQSNGIAERFVRTLKEWLEDKSWQSAEELGLLLDQFHTEYNDRPHQGLSIKGLSPNEFAKRL